MIAQNENNSTLKIFQITVFAIFMVFLILVVVFLPEPNAKMHFQVVFLDSNEN